MNQKIRKFTIQQKFPRHKRSFFINRFLKFIMVFFSLFKKKKGGNFRSNSTKFISYLPTIIFSLILASFIGILVVFAWVRRDLPDPNKIADRSVAQTTKIYDRTGETVLFEVHGAEKRTVIDLKDMSPYVINSTIVAEDRDFYTHKGFKITGYIRAFAKNLISGDRRQGGSTITQQLVKNALLTPEKTYTRKLKELLLSIEIERSFSKDDILKMYLNEIPYGSVVYGIESAAESFFGKTAAELTLSESALLASLPRSTTYLSPYGSHTNELITRQHWVLDSLVSLGYITSNEAEEAKTDNVLERIKPKTGSIIAPHFVFYIREQLAEKLGEQVIERGGLKIITTLDLDKQKLAEETIKNNYSELVKSNANNAALLSLNPKNGEILAMVGSADYFNDDIDGKFNVLLGLRQPGSSIKPLVYSTAFERGYTPDTVLFDVVTQFSPEPNAYIPKDYDELERGPVTIREALAGSLNIPAVKALYLAGLDNVLVKAKELGYTTLNDRNRLGLSLALGGGEVKPIEHITAFSAYANDGILIPIRGVLKVEDRNGSVVIDNTKPFPGKRVLSEQVVRQINSILSDNVARTFIFGANSYLKIDDRPVAAKTGTTNSYKDAWIIGYTPSLVTGVWVGNSDNQEMKRGSDGSKIAAPIWNSFMRQILSNSVFEEFIAPEPIITGKPILDGNKQAQVTLKIDSISGLLATEFTPEELIVEKGYGIPHSILSFVDKNDPRGPIPEHPENDPMFAYWEEAISKWVNKNGRVPTIEQPPTLTDNVHLPENKPQIKILQPTNNLTIDSRNVFVDLDLNAKRGIVEVEFSINGDKFAVFNQPPFSGTISIPNRFPKGFHTLMITAYDDVKNRSSAEITINLTADTEPIDVQWISPINSQLINHYNFPTTVQFRIEDNANISLLELSTRSLINGTEEVIGVIENPPLPNMSIRWHTAPLSGRYTLRLSTILKNGERHVEEILITIQ
jgi:membrane peptidoglycan carboxypeptidase